MPFDSTAGPLPKFPEFVTLPQFDVTSTPAKSLQVPASLSFYYAGISAIWIWYRAPLELLNAYLHPLGMTAYSFGDGEGAVNINFFNALAFYGMGQPGNQGVGGFNETEINIVAHATAITKNVPLGITLPEYLTAGDPTKRLGNYRVWVACDDAVAVAAGQQVFMENKFLMQYEYNVPAANNPRPAPDQFTWDWTAFDMQTPPEPIYIARVRLDGLSAVDGNSSEVIDLSFDAESRRPVASRRNFFGMFDTYLQPTVCNAVSLTYGSSTHTMRHDMHKLIGASSAVALQVFRSPTCIAEVAGYYADL